MVAHKVNNELGGLFGIVLVDKVKVRKPLLARFQRRNFAPIDKVGIADDFALGRLAENFGQFHHRNHARSDDVREHVAGANRGQLVHVAHQHKGCTQRHGLEQVVEEQGVHHGCFVNHKQAAGEGVVLVTGKAVFLGAVFEQAVDGARFAPRGFGHALGGAARGRGQQNAGANLAKKFDDGVDNGGFARAGAAGEHHNLAAGGGAYCLKLLSRKRNIELAHHLVHECVGLFKAHRLGRTQKPLDVEGGFGFAVVVAAHVHAHLAKGSGHVQFFTHNALVCFKGRKGVFHQAFVHAQLGTHGLNQFCLGQVDVAIVGGFLQHIERARLYAQRVVVRKTQFAGGSVCGDKADAVDVHGQAVGIFAHNGEGFCPVGAVDAHRIGRSDAVGLQKEQQVAHAPVFGPRGADAVEAFAAHAAHLEQALGLFVENAYGVCAKGFHNAPGHFFANALD